MKGPRGRFRKAAGRRGKEKHKKRGKNPTHPLPLAKRGKLDGLH